MAEAYLDPLDAIEWVQGGESVRGSASARYRAVPHEGEWGLYDITKPFTYTLAQNLAQMINAIQERRTHIQMPRYDFAFMGTADTTAAAIAAAADETLQELNFFGRPVIQNGGGHALTRYLRATGTWAPEDEDELEATFYITLVNLGDDAEPDMNWAWAKNDPDALTIGGPVQAGYLMPGISTDWMELDVSEGLKIAFKFQAPELVTIDGTFDHVSGVHYYRAGGAENQLRWTIRAHKNIRREPYQMAYVWLCQMMEAIEDCQLGNVEAEYDFGDGDEAASILWTGGWPAGDMLDDFDEHLWYSLKGAFTDCDCIRQGGYQTRVLEGVFADGGSILLTGMYGGFQDVRRAINDLRWATALEKTATAGSLTIDWVLNKEVGGGLMGTVQFVEGVDADPGVWAEAYKTYRSSGGLFTPFAINSQLTYDRIRVTVHAGPTYRHTRNFTRLTFAYVFKVINATGEPRVWSLNLAPTDNGAGAPSFFTDAAGSNVSEFYKGIYANDDEDSLGAIWAAIAADDGTTTAASIVDMADFVRGAQLVDEAGGDAPILVPPGTNYYAYIWWPMLATHATAAWRSTTSVPPADAPHALEEVARGSDTNFSVELTQL